VDTPLAANLINLGLGILSLFIVIAAFVAIWMNRQQAREDWQHSQRLALEERQHQSRPIIVPLGEFTPSSATETSALYQSNGVVIWNYQNKIKLTLQNMGGGVAVNVHCVFYGPESIYASQFVSWDNGPVGDNPVQVLCEHPAQLHLAANDTIDGVHPLYNTAPTSSSNPIEYRIACLTVTYHDLFETKHVSIFNYTLEHRWVCVVIGKIPLVKGNVSLDLKELNDQKKQQAPKFSAPPIPLQEN
jgi:hypothetical protein